MPLALAKAASSLRVGSGVRSMRFHRLRANVAKLVEWLRTLPPRRLAGFRPLQPTAPRSARSARQASTSPCAWATRAPPRTGRRLRRGRLPPRPRRAHAAVTAPTRRAARPDDARPQHHQLTDLTGRPGDSRLVGRRRFGRRTAAHATARGLVGTASTRRRHRPRNEKDAPASYLETEASDGKSLQGQAAAGSTTTV